MKQVKFANYDRKTQLMAVNFTDGTSRIYKGSGVVWFEYPSMAACETYVCSELFTMWSEIETFGGDYTPTKLPKGDWLMVSIIFIIVSIILAGILGAFILSSCESPPRKFRDWEIELTYQNGVKEIKIVSSCSPTTPFLNEKGCVQTQMKGFKCYKIVACGVRDIKILSL